MSQFEFALGEKSDMFRYTMNDKILLSAWQQGDQEAGRQLVHRHYSSVARFFFNKAGPDTSDLIQRTFLKLMESHRRMHDDSNVRAYLLGIARHVLHDYYRACRREGDGLVDVESLCVVDLSPSPSSVVVNRKEAHLLLQGLRGIPLESQMVLELYYWEQLKAREIAIVLDVPEGTIRTRIRRARQLLEESLARLQATPGLIKSTISDLESWADTVREQLRGREGEFVASGQRGPSH